MAIAPPNPNDLTRQQLDELDALLQRMLTLPINAPEPVKLPPSSVNLAVFAPPLPPPIPVSYMPPAREAPLPFAESYPAAPAPKWRTDPPSVPPTPAPHLYAPPPEPAPVARKVAAPPQVAPPVQPAPAAPAPVTEEAELPATDFVVAPAMAKAVAPPAPIAPPPLTPIAPIESPSANLEPLPPILAPLVLLNRIVNGTLGMLGFPGRVLRTGFVKTLFGLAGIGLLAYTGVKAAQIHGWVTLSQDLPWPR